MKNVDISKEKLRASILKFKPWAKHNHEVSHTAEWESQDFNSSNLTPNGQENHLQ